MTDIDDEDERAETDNEGVDKYPDGRPLESPRGRGHYFF